MGRLFDRHRHKKGIGQRGNGGRSKPEKKIASISAAEATGGNLPLNSVGTSNLVDGAVVTTKIAEHSVTADKLGLTWLSVPAAAGFADALSRLKAQGGGVLVVPAGDYPIPADTVVDPGITLRLMNGARLNIAQGKVLTINGGVEAGLYPIFTGSGIVRGALAEYYPQWFGAAADGNADDSAGIQAAVNAADGSGATVVLPAGTYKIREIKLQNRMKLRGEKGAVLEPFTAGQDAKLTASGAAGFEVADLEGPISLNILSSSDFVIRNLRVRQNVEGWHIYQSEDGQLMDNRIVESANKDERFIYLNDCTRMLVQGNQIRNQTLFNGADPNSNTGINISSSSYCQIVNNYVENCGGQGICFDTNTGIADAESRACFSNIAAGNIVIGNGQEGITAFASKQYETYDITVVNNICINNRYNGIEFWGVRQGVIEGNSISAPAMKEYSFGAINIFATKDVIIDGNSIENVPTSGIALVNGPKYAESRCQNIIITSNRILNWNNLDLSPATNHDQICGINLFNADCCLIQGNLLIDTRPGRKNIVKAISVVEGRHLIRGNINPQNLLIDDHVEADLAWAGHQIAERTPFVRFSSLPGDVNNGVMTGVDPGTVWYNHSKRALFYKGYDKTMLTPLVLDEKSTSGFPSGDYAQGFFSYQTQTGRLFYRGKPNNSNGKYAEVVLKDKFINLKRSTEVSKTPVEGDTYYDTVRKKPVYYDGANWRDFSGNIVSVNP
ncbi:right-handed parallel beta-helix repeat-containing protein [Paenibacillus sp. Y412MC10]|uniref:right-handed parallel beta-helix repeat-containing protein n=1 Tax=Geobacillus sp. (strain Y412MC10) TaxID=481743 RepID=UPI0011A5B4E7|nr:right-handed parallel beta-helix repeat-containing protein [Paenibacillus sp. Y412MC10]